MATPTRTPTIIPANWPEGPDPVRKIKMSEPFEINMYLSR